MLHFYQLAETKENKSQILAIAHTKKKKWKNRQKPQTRETSEQLPREGEFHS